MGCGRMNYEEQFASILVESANEHGYTDEQVLAEFGKTDSFSMVYEQDAIEEGFENAEDLLEADLARLRGAEYPTDECLRPHEIEKFVRDSDVPMELRIHVGKCRPCAALLAAVAVEPARLAAFVAELATANRPGHRKDTLGMPDYANFEAAEADVYGQAQSSPESVVGEALYRFANTIQQVGGQRRSIFRTVLESLEQRLNVPGFHREMIYQADRTGLADWAVESLLSLYIPLSDSGRHALAWHYTVACIPKVFQVDLIASLCRGVVYEVLATAEAAVVLRDVASVWEKVRLGVPFGTNAAMRTAVLNAMATRAKSAGPHDAAMDAARRAIESSDALLPDPDRVINALVLLKSSRLHEPSSPLRDVLVPVTILFENRLKMLRKIAKRRGEQDIAAALVPAE